MNQHDLRAYVAAAHNYKAGRDYYRTHHMALPEDATLTSDIPQYIYPPIALLLFLPATLLRFDVFRRLWCALSVVLLGHALYMLGMLAPGTWPVVAAVGVAVLLGDPLRYLLDAGQIDALILWLTVAAASLLLHGYGVLAGYVMALACWLKVAPALLALYIVRCTGLYSDYTAGLLLGGVGLFGIQSALLGLRPFEYWLRVCLPCIMQWHALTPDAQSMRALMPNYHGVGKGAVLFMLALLFLAPPSVIGIGACVCASVLLPNLGWTMQGVHAILPLWLIGCVSPISMTILSMIYIGPARYGMPGIAMLLMLLWCLTKGACW